MSISEQCIDSLVERYDELKKERKSVDKEIAAIKEEVMTRIQESEFNEIETEVSNITVKVVEVTRVKSLNEIEDEFGAEWMDENRRRLTKTVESQRLYVKKVF
jgi:hypothetical protein